MRIFRRLRWARKDLSLESRDKIAQRSRHTRQFGAALLNIERATSRILCGFGYATYIVNSLAASTGSFAYVSGHFVGRGVLLFNRSGNGAGDAVVCFSRRSLIPNWRRRSTAMMICPRRLMRPRITRDQRNVSHLLVAQDFLNLQNGHAKIVSIEEKSAELLRLTT